MLIKLRRASEPKSSEITSKDVFLDRRRFIAETTGLGVAAMAFAALPTQAKAAPPHGMPLANVAKTAYGKGEKPNDFDAVAGYNNFYEFGTDKGDPIDNARKLKTRPWTVVVDGACAKPGQIGIDDLIKPHQLEERVYRLRCVEAWSMVVPWVGFALKDLLARFEPLGSAKFVRFETLADKAQMPGVGSRILEWPYVEGLRMDEAMHPLAMMVVGLYGEVLPNQNGAPIRLMTPWKYGFKAVKSIVRISFVETMPRTAWNISAPREYGFYANVNPKVDHPRWSQARERRIGEFMRRETMMFNGYAEEVGGLYAGMDLAKWY